MAEYKGEVILNSNEPSGQYVPYHGEVDYSKIGTPAEKSQIASEQDTRSLADKIVSAGLKGAAFTVGAEGALAKLAPVGNALRVGGELSTYSAGQTAKTALATRLEIRKISKPTHAISQCLASVRVGREYAKLIVQGINIKASKP